MSNLLRILIISHNHPEFSIGGGENAAYTLFRELNCRPDCQALFMAVRYGVDSPHLGSSFSVYTPDGSEILFYTKCIDFFLFSQLECQKTWHDFRILLEKFKPHIVHYHHYMNLGLEFIREVQRYSATVPIVLTLHEYKAICHHNGQMVTTTEHKLCYGSSLSACHQCFPDRSSADFKLRELFIKSFFRLVDCFISPSHFLIERYVQWGLPRKKMVFVENGQKFQTPTSDRILLPGENRARFAYFGQINPFKGLTVLLDAMNQLPTDTDFRISLDIYGSFLELQSETYQRQFRELLDRVSHLVCFNGAYRHQDLAKLMFNIDWVVVPSVWWENSPLVIQEAFGHGRPVICSDIGGMAEKVIPYKNGLHFLAGDAKDLAQRLIEAASTPGLWESLRAGIVVPPTINETCNKHIELYRCLIEEKNRLAVAEIAEA